MATLREKGSITAHCRGCSGATSTYEFHANSKEFGCFTVPFHRCSGPSVGDGAITYRLYRCAGCGQGAIAAISHQGNAFPGGGHPQLEWFYPESVERLPLPEGVPKGIEAEFREAEACLAAGFFRAASGLFRSTLEKVLKSNGYIKERNLPERIRAAAGDGVITEARRKRADEEVRVLGNDVLHDEWQELDRSAVALSHHYTQRIIEDFYDDRETVTNVLVAAKRLEDEDGDLERGQ